jgi:hypothetical protein
MKVIVDVMFAVAVLSCCAKAVDSKATLSIAAK